jgi:hypothetical protein
MDDAISKLNERLGTFLRDGTGEAAKALEDWVGEVG